MRQGTKIDDYNLFLGLLCTNCKLQLGYEKRNVLNVSSEAGTRAQDVPRLIKVFLFGSCFSGLL